MKARVTVTLKNGVLDPQGKAIEGALKSLGVEGIANVRQGKVLDIELETADKGQAGGPEGGMREAAGEHGHRELPRRADLIVAPGPDPGIRDFARRKAWMAGTGPAMTTQEWSTQG